MKELNWGTIENNYPKSYNKLVGEDAESQKYIVLSHSKEPLWDMEENAFNIRDLYDFFDDNGLTILLTCEFDFGFEILDNRYETIEQVKKWYQYRNDAEVEAFEYAFRMLESKL